MGGSSKAVTVGYRYFLGMHMILCHGPVDKLTHVFVDKKTAWVGANTGGPLTISATDLFGGESREGGVSGTVDFETGSPTQVKNSYLMSKLGSNISAYRGVAAAVLRQCYLGINPYLKNWAFRVQRIHVRARGTPQWYDAKAAVFNTGLVIAPGKSNWRYKVVSRSDSSDYSSPSLDDSAWAVGAAPFSNFRDPSSTYWLGPLSHGFSKEPGTIVAEESKVWMRTTINLTEVPDSFQFETWIDNDCSFYVNGVLAASPGGYNGAYYSITIPSSFFNVGNNHICAVGVDRHAGPGNWYYFDWRLRSQELDIYDMNPVHIIRECLTDPDWGMGYLESDVDDASFMAAADQLYSEGFGISILWDRQTIIEDFVKEIIRHINAALYVDRTSGKFVLKLVRNDYNPSALLVLGEGNVEKVENFARPAFGDMVNSVTVNYWDSATGTTASITAQDTALIQMQGAVVGTTIQYPGCTNPNLAARLASRDLTTLSTPLLSCTIYADRTASALNIGDVFKLDWPDYQAAPVVMRVMAMAFGDGRSNRIKITATEDAFALPEVVAIVPQPPEWVDPISPPTMATKRAVQEAPYFEMVQRMGQSAVDAALATEPDSGYVIAAAARPGSAINARLAVDAGAGYADNDVSLDFCASAKLATDAGYQDTVLQLEEVTDGALIEAGTHALLGGVEEVYVTAVDLDAETITVRRGVLDTVPHEHAAGAVILFWDVYSDGDQTEYVAGEHLDVKVLPVTGAGELSLAAAPTDSLDMDSRAIRPYPPANVTLNGEYYPASVVGDLSLEWASRNRVQQTGSDLVGWFDASVTEEAGVAYSLRVVDVTTETDVYSLSGITGVGPTVVPSGDIVYHNRLEMWATRDGYESLQRFVHEFFAGFDVSNTFLGAANNLVLHVELEAADATGEVAWTVVSGSLPNGVVLQKLAGTSALITGIPQGVTPGYYDVTIRAEDENGVYREKALTIPVGNLAFALPFTGANGATTFPDLTGKTWNRSGNTVISTTDGDFPDGAALFDGSGDYLTASAGSTDWQWGTADLSVGLWLKHAAATGGGSNNDKGIFGSFDATPFYIFLSNSNLAPALWNGSTQYTSPTAAVPAATRTYLGYSRRAGQLYMSINGEVVHSATMTTNFNSTTARRIGGETSSRFFNGRMSRLVGVKGVSWYDGAYDPPTYPLVYNPAEKTTNGTFATGTGWANDSGAAWSITSGAAVCDGSTGSVFVNTAMGSPAAAGKYLVKLVLSAYTSGGVKVSLYDSATSTEQALTAVATATGTAFFVVDSAAAFNTVRLVQDAAFVGSVDEVSVRPLQ